MILLYNVTTNETKGIINHHPIEKYSEIIPKTSINVNGSINSNKHDEKVTDFGIHSTSLKLSSEYFAS